MSNHNVYEMLWDCQFCGTKKNLGLTHRFCPNCGAPQNPESRYYPSDAEKVAVKDHQFVGVDVICPACNELNSASAEFCGQCGSPLTEGARAKTLEAQSRASGGSFESSGSRDIVKERFDQQMQAIGVQPVPNTKKKRTATSKPKIMAIIGLVVLVLGAIFTAFNLKKEVTVLASEHEWERVITVQEYDNFTTRSWRDSPPVGDSVSMVPGSCQREQRSTRRVADGQTCRTVRQDNGDGTFSERQECTTNYREEPVYDDMCTWRGMRWEFDREERTSGGLDRTPYWAQLSLNCEGQRRVGCERESNRDERYIVHYDSTTDDSQYQCTYAQSDWEAIPPNSRWTGQARALIPNSLLCDTLTRQ